MTIISKYLWLISTYPTKQKHSIIPTLKAQGPYVYNEKNEYLSNSLIKLKMLVESVKE